MSGSVLGAVVGAQPGLPRLVFTPPIGMARPTFYVYAKPETEVFGIMQKLPDPNPGPAFVRVKPRPEHGMNPHIFVRRDDPFFHLAELAT